MGQVIYGFVTIGDLELPAENTPGLMSLNGIYPPHDDGKMFYGAFGVVTGSKLEYDIPVSVIGLLPGVGLDITTYNLNHYITLILELSATNVTDWQWMFTHDGGDTWNICKEKTGVLTGIRYMENAANVGIKCRVWNGGLWRDSDTIFGDGSRVENGSGGAVAEGDPVVYIAGVVIEETATQTSAGVIIPYQPVISIATLGAIETATQTGTKIILNEA